MKSSNVKRQTPTVTRAGRERISEHKSAVVWFTGLSGSGKTTLAYAVEERLRQLSCPTFVLDGDNMRHGLCSDLGFSNMERKENIRRVGEVAKLFFEAGHIVLAALISPFEHDRARVRSILPPGDFIEVYCKCSLSVCEERDVKGLYKRVRAGEIVNFTGISSPYEEPVFPALRIDTEVTSLDEAVELVLNLLVAHCGIVHRAPAAFNRNRS
jgi:adenylylsulfate kinase